MINYFKCFNKTIKLKLPFEPSENLFFWLKRFCPNVEIIKSNKKENKYNFYIEFVDSNIYDYELKDQKIFIYGKLINYESFVAKFITQCFQKLLLEDDILIVPAACVTKNNKSILIIGDFWQGKTSVAINLTKKYNLKLGSDNYVAIKKGKIIGVTNYISLRKEEYNKNYESLLNINDRYFCKNEYFEYNNKLEIKGLLLPYINNGDNNIHFISEEESKWYLYQKFTRLLCGETVLFNGKLPSPVFLDKELSKKIMNIVDELLINIKIKYVSSSMDIIISEGYKSLCEGETDE